MSADPNTEAFEAFWATYPRITAKGAARIAWNRAVTKVTANTIMTALHSQIAAGDFDRMKENARAKGMQEKQLIPHPATWLNGERWADGSLTADAPPIDPTQPKRPLPDWLVRKMMEDCSWYPSPGVRSFIESHGNTVPERPAHVGFDLGDSEAGIFG